MPSPSRNDIYEAVIRKMVAQALEAKEDCFLQDHKSDTEEELIGYLQQSAKELGYSPRYKEIEGWKLMKQRFGSWNGALEKAGLSPAARYPVTKLPRIMEETERQKEQYRQNKAKKKRKHQQRMETQAQRKKENAKI